MTNRKKFFYNGIMLTLVALAIRSVSMAFNAYVTREVGAEGIGLFTLIMTVYSFAVTFATSGISLTVTRLVASASGNGERKKVRQIMRNAFLYSLVFSGFASLVLFFGAGYFGVGVLCDRRAVYPLRILALSLIPLSLSSVFGGYFVGVKRVANNAAVQILGQVLRILTTVFLVLRLTNTTAEKTVASLCMAITLTELGVFFIGFLQFIFDKKPKAAENGQGASFFDITSTALPLALSAYVRSALLTLEHVLIPKRLRDSGLMAAEALSLYGMLHGMALPLLLYPMSPLSSFSGLLVPEFAEGESRRERGRMERIASEALTVTLSYAVVAAVLLYVFAEELGYAIYNSYGAGHYIALMAPIVPIMYLDHVTDSILKGIGEQVYSMWVNVTDSLLSVFLIWFLIPQMGIGGYAVVIVVMEGYNFVLSSLRLRRRIGFRIDIKKALILPLVSSLFAALLCRSLFIMNGGNSTLLWLFLKMFFSITVYIGVNLVIKRVIIPTFAKVNQNKA